MRFTCQKSAYHWYYARGFIASIKHKSTYRVNRYRPVLCQFDPALSTVMHRATLNLGELRSKGLNAWFSSAFKLLLAPILITCGAYFWGFSNFELGLLFFMTAAPTAAASYVMARSMGGNANLAANIIAITTAGSLITYSLGLSVLYSLNFFA